MLETPFAFPNLIKPKRPQIRSAGGRIFTTLPTHEEIARRAREIYLSSGCCEGQSEQNWFQAERELLTEAAALQQDSESEPPLDESAEPVQEVRGYAPAFRSPRLRLTGTTG